MTVACAFASVVVARARAAMGATRASADGGDGDAARDGATTSSHASWRRASLGYQEKFVHEFTCERARVSQFASRSAFAKATRREGGGDDGRLGECDADVVPETAFTVWDASIVLGKYASRDDVWSRLDARGRAGGRASVALELGAGTGLASLMIATSDAVRARGGVFALTDLPDVVEFTKRNARDNKAEHGGHVPRNCALAVTSIRWGRVEDIDGLPEALRWPDVVLGADLMYTSDADVIEALAKTTTMLLKPGCVGVFAACKEHRPEAIEMFVKFMEPEFDVRRVPASMAHPEYPCDDDDFEILEFTRRS